MSLSGNLKWGASWGAWFGIGYAVLGGIIWALGGQEVFRKYHMTPLVYIAGHLIGGVCAGLIMGLLRPALRWRIGAAVVGVVAVAPFSVFVNAALVDYQGWSGHETMLAVIGSILLGGGGGYVLWEPPKRGRPSKLRRRGGSHPSGV